jgi:hypothetical protein
MEMPQLITSALKKKGLQMADYVVFFYDVMADA